MDPNVSASVSQKTSPEQDLAALHRLSTEVSSQASVLAAHQQQLVKLTSMTEELVRSMRSPSARGPAPAGATTSSESPIQKVSTHLGNPGNPRLSLPVINMMALLQNVKDSFLQCSIFINQQPNFYSTNKS